MKKQTIKIFTSIENLANNAAALLKRKVNELPDGEYFTIALSGGLTPKLIFNYLIKDYSDKIDWKKIKLFWGDERCVPTNHNESNFKMTYESLLCKISIPEENIFRIYGEGDPIKEADRYSEIIKNNVHTENGLPSFNLILLGLGEDGHTASIFPNQLALFYSDDLYTITKHPQSKQNRITVTGKVINNAKRVVFLVTGGNKAQIVAEIINADNGKILPATLVTPSNGELVWMLDVSAAQLLDSEVQTMGIIS